LQIEGQFALLVDRKLTAFVHETVDGVAVDFISVPKLPISLVTFQPFMGIIPSLTAALNVCLPAS
jgi:hypothetical protein